MKVRGDLPPGAFTVEAQPKKPGAVLVRFYENVQAFEQVEDGLTITGYEYDEYHLEMSASGGVTDYVLNNYNQLMARAKAADAAKDEPSLEDKIRSLEEEKAELLTKTADLEAQVTDTQMVLCDLYEQMMGGV